jgi:hypothetical protein
VGAQRRREQIILNGRGQEYIIPIAIHCPAELAARVLRYRDPETGEHLVERILDQAEQKGAGRFRRWGIRGWA